MQTTVPHSQRLQGLTLTAKKTNYVKFELLNLTVAVGTCGSCWLLCVWAAVEPSEDDPLNKHNKP